jgi:hypothetical protein
MVAFAKNQTPPHTLARELKYRLAQVVTVLCWFITEAVTLGLFFGVALFDTAIRGKDADEQLKDA